MSDVKLRIGTLDGFFAAAAAGVRRIGAGDLRAQPAVIAFESMETFLRVLTANRLQLLRALKRQGRASVRQLATLPGRDEKAVLDDVQALTDAGLIDRDARGRICVPWDTISAEMAIDLAA